MDLIACHRLTTGSTGRPVRAITIAACVALLLFMTTPAAVAKPDPTGTEELPGQPVPAGFTNWEEVYSVQRELNATAGRILRADDAGNPSIIANPLHRELLVYWNGPVPRAVREQAETAKVPVRFRTANYTLRELTIEARRIAGDARVVSAAPDPDGSGLAVTVTHRSLDAGHTDILGTAKMPVKLTIGDRLQLTAGRQGDTPYFWGGSAYSANTNPFAWCSTGFTVLKPNHSLPSRAMLSAAHCAPLGGNITIKGRPNPTGSVEAGSIEPCRDTLILNLPDGAAGVVYINDYNSDRGRVVGGNLPYNPNFPDAPAEFDFVGNLVTTSGAYSGEHTNIAVNRVNVFTQLPNVNCVGQSGPFTEAISAGRCVVSRGDSGGPVYAADYRGRGTIVEGGGRSLPCATADPNDQWGFDTVYYAPLLRPVGAALPVGSLQHYGVRLAPEPVRP